MSGLANLLGIFLLAYFVLRFRALCMLYLNHCLVFESRATSGSTEGRYHSSDQANYPDTFETNATVSRRAGIALYRFYVGSN